ncbi:hypothetical protein AB0H43_32640 [Hamadaea sp. NPDC050747]|uniref:hypothetical protein n=1 Tax=Hamadaea sp. NPDC050747 TaxID=3155789 RepID=UPI0033CC092C
MEASPRHQAAAIYGTIISGSVMAAAPQDSVLTVVVLVLVTVFVYWLAERYADLLGAYAHGHHLTRADVRHSLSEGLPLIRASYAPLIVLIVAALLGADTPAALTIAMGFTVAWLFLMGFIAGRRRGVTGWPLVIVTGAAGLFGVVLMVLKLSLH